MNDRDSFGFPFLLTGANEQTEMPHRQSDLDRVLANIYSVHRIPSGAAVQFYPDPNQSKLSRAKAIAAEVCARRFPVTKIPKEQQE